MTRIEPSIRLRRAIYAGDAALVRRILKSHSHLLHNPDVSSSSSASSSLSSSSLPSLPSPGAVAVAVAGAAFGIGSQGQGHGHGIGDAIPAVGLSNSNLHLASSLGHRETCAALLDAGHEHPAPALNENHQTALMLAAAAGHADVVHLLCDHDTRAEAGDGDGDGTEDAGDRGRGLALLHRDIRGRDAVMSACAGGHDTVLQLLLTYHPAGPADAVRRADVDGNTALHFASARGSLLCLRTLLAAGADPDRRNLWNWTPLSYSATVQTEVYLRGLMSELAVATSSTTMEKKQTEAETEAVVEKTSRRIGLALSLFSGRA